MSTVRMCDYMTSEGPCGTIFSERELGWSTGTMTVIGDDGETVTERADFCPEHSPSAAKKGRKYPRFNARTAALPAARSDGGEASSEWPTESPTSSSGPW